MKKILIGFICLVALGTSLSAEGNAYSQCKDWCVKNYKGEIWDTNTERGACVAGCSNAHWTDSKRGVSNCLEEYNHCNVFLEAACKAGSGQYGKE